MPPMLQSETLHRVTELLAQHAQLFDRLITKIDALIELQQGENVVLATLKHEVADRVREDFAREIATVLGAAKVAALAAGGEGEGGREPTGKHLFVVGEEGVAVAYGWGKKALYVLVPVATGALGWLVRHLSARGGHP